MSSRKTSFLDIEGLHVFITGAAGGIGGAAVEEFLENGCRVTALDLSRVDISKLSSNPELSSRLHTVEGNLTSESSVAAAFASATAKFGCPNILVANAGITDETAHPPIWEITTESWNKVNTNNVFGTFLTLKYFLLEVKNYQLDHDSELPNLAIVITGSETGVWGQEGHAEYASGKAGLQYGLVRGVKNEIVRLNSKARINAVAPGWVNTPLIGNRLDDPREMWTETQATVALKKIAQPEDVARLMTFLASHRAAGHITGQCISCDGGMEGRLIWKEEQVSKSETPKPIMPLETTSVEAPSIPLGLRPNSRPRRLRICLSVDFDAISGYLGTGHNPHNTLSDFSAGILSARVGVPRLLKLFAKHGISSNLTWFIPGHSMETFPAETAHILASGAEIALHGYSHEGAYSMTPTQEKEVLEKCIKLATELKNGKRPVGYRAPLYQIRESTVRLLQQHGFLYDSSMNAHDSMPYFLPSPFPLEPPQVPDYSKAAESWMHPTSLPKQPVPGSKEAADALVEIPGSWYTEYGYDSLGFYPYEANTQGYVAVDVVEKMWWDRFDWLWENECFTDEEEEAGAGGFGSVFPLVWHPESAGRAHIIGMVNRFIERLKQKAREEKLRNGEITFETMESTAKAWKNRGK